MLFYTWPFLLFVLVVLPVFFALRRTPFLDCLVAGRILLLLRVVESVLPAAGDLFDAAGLPAGNVGMDHCPPGERKDAIRC